jgi:hypothetical protein
MKGICKACEIKKRARFGFIQSYLRCPALVVADLAFPLPRNEKLDEDSRLIVGKYHDDAGPSGRRIIWPSREA